KFVTGNSRESGSGLGLAFCKMAVAAHGERIWVDSQPGQGSAFKFTLAIARHAPRLLHPRPAAQPAPVLLN
ncbi:MAG: ATP-binding protein, partial [Anaerolineae bacterium]